MCLFVIAFFTMLFGGFFFVVPASTTTVPVMEMTPTFTFTPETDPFADVLPAGEASPTVAPGANVPAQPTFTPPPPDFGPTMTTTPTPSGFGPTMTTTPPPDFGPTVTTTPPPFSTSSAGALPFVQIEEVMYIENFVNDAGCDWQGIAGLVVDMSGTPVRGIFQVRILAPGSMVYTAAVTSDSVFGEGGWEQKLADAPVSERYIVQLTDAVGTPLSEPVDITFPGTCGGNLAVVYFMQQYAF